MNRIDQKFNEDKKLLSIYFSAGFPNLEDTVPILKKLEAAQQETGIQLMKYWLVS